MLGIGSVDDCARYRERPALCALSEWDGFQITLERGRGKAAYESSQASLFLRLRKTSLHF